MPNAPPSTPETNGKIVYLIFNLGSFLDLKKNIADKFKKEKTSDSSKIYSTTPIALKFG